MKRINVLTALMLLFATLMTTSCEKIDDWFGGGGDDSTDVININPEYVPIDWDAATLLSSDDSTGDYQIQFTDSVPDIHPGSILTIDRDTAVLYRFVVTAEVSGNTMSLTTVEASLTDIFYDTEFTLSTEAQGKSQAKGAVFYPVEVCLLDEKGGYEVMDIDWLRKGDTRFTHNLWNHTLFDLDGQVLFSGSNWAITLEKMNASLGVDLEMFMNFGGRTVRETVNEAVDRYRSKALQMNASLVGRFNTEQRIRFDAEGSFSYTPDYDLWKHNLFRPVTVKFAVAAGPVVIPIVLTLRSDLFRQVAASGSGHIAAYTGFTDQAEGRVGFEWSQTGGINPVMSFNNTFSFTPPTIEGKGQVQAKVWVFPRIRVMLYDRVGPSFDFMPWMSDTVRGGFREETLGQSNDYCAWSLDHYAGLDLRCGLSLNNLLFGYEVRNYSTERMTCANVKLYHSPKRIEHVSGRPDAGETTTVRFTVYDQNYLFNNEMTTPFPQIVKFEAGGQLSSEYGIAHNGTVSVDWTPNGNDTLWAKLYDQDGNVISFDTVIVSCNCNVITTTWVDLGLPSGLLWASCNVGATSPEDYGNYYAWGETSPKSVYDWNTYRYCNGASFKLTKYCNYSSYGNNGFTDNLTVLQPSDDAATVNMGGGARTPTKEEWQELGNNTTHQWTSYNGVYGLCLTGSNGKSLFLPAAGHRYGSSLGGAGGGRYWSSSLDTAGPDIAWHFYFFGGYWFVIDYYDRTFGLSVRAVRDSGRK